MPEPEYRAILLFGAPGVGKGTQGQRFGLLPHYRHLSTGEMFRALDPNSSLGKEVREFTDRGELVPDELTIRIFNSFVRSLVDSSRFNPNRDILVLDGIPRNVNQCRVLDNEIRVVRIIHLVGSNIDVMVARIKRRAEIEGRKDDADEDVIRHRMEVYRRETQPVLGYYPPALVLKVDALGTPDEVAAVIQNGLSGS